MSNKTKAAGRPSTNKNIKKIGEHGIYGANPSFPEYKQDMGKDTIPTKFAESTIGRTMRRTNPVSSARQTDNLRPSSMNAINGSATVLTGKNRYDSVKGGVMGNKKSGR